MSASHIWIHFTSNSTIAQNSKFARHPIGLLLPSESLQPNHHVLTLRKRPIVSLARSSKCFLHTSRLPRLSNSRLSDNNCVGIETCDALGYFDGFLNHGLGAAGDTVDELILECFLRRETMAGEGDFGSDLGISCQLCVFGI